MATWQFVKAILTLIRRLGQLSDADHELSVSSIFRNNGPMGLRIKYHVDACLPVGWIGVHTIRAS
jgi:hypothetical protein